MSDPTLFLNGFRIELSADRFRAFRWPLPDTGTVAELRADHPDWSLWRRGDDVLAVLVGDEPIPAGRSSSSAAARSWAS